MSAHITDEELRDKLERAQAEAASLRQKLAAAHGALWHFKKPAETKEEVFAPIEDWDWNPNAARDLGAAYGSLAELLNETRPEPDEGMELLVELRDLRQKLDEATMAAMTCEPDDLTDTEYE